MPGAAHPGGLNKEGCHNDRRTGGYHCHRAPLPASPAPAGGAEGGRPSFAPAGTDEKKAPPGRAFRNCDEARAYGAAPVRRGDPGYGPHLDRDNDGVGCEPYRGR
ncbi:excalibur calcium-binding domain-containing protein [Pseudoxanthomonas putridarboris]|uniref:excalibur calcium-binding domain-containing protein n=1 Tax=Pseudoxanthomonas putridarboris TaxID=752605 RepID=UPI0031F31881